MTMARVIERRLWVKLTGKSILRQYMRYRGMTVNELAMRSGVHRATIGFLCSEGKSSRTTCTPDNAAAIERALDVPQGLLFEENVSTVSRDIKRKVA